MDNSTKIIIIKANSCKYRISAMCKVLNISRSTYYYEASLKTSNSKLENAVISIFKESRNNYGTRKIKIELAKIAYIVSRRKISKIMSKYGLVSNYTIKQFKVHKATCNNENVANIVNQEFDNRNHLEVVVSDLTYVNVRGKWKYICIILDIFNRDIIGYAAGKIKMRN